MDYSELQIDFGHGPGVTSTFTADQPWRDYPPFRFTLVLDGRGAYCFEDGDVAVGPGDLLLIQPGPRLIRIDDDALRVHWVPFRLWSAGARLRRLAGQPVGRRFVGSDRDLQLLRQSYADLRRLVHERPVPPRAELQLRVMLDLFGGAVLPVDDPIPLAIRDAAQALALYPELRPSVEDLAAGAGLSASQFRRLFRRHYGMSPLRYAIDRRLEAADRLLAMDGLSVQDTAAQLGYPDAFTFSRQFRLHRGHPPSQHG